MLKLIHPSCSIRISIISLLVFLGAAQSFALSITVNPYEDPDIQSCTISDRTQEIINSVEETVQALSDQGIGVTFNDGIGYASGADYRKNPNLTKSQGANVNFLMAQITRDLINSGESVYAADTQSVLNNPDLLEANGGEAPGRTLDFEIFSSNGKNYIRPRVIDYRDNEPRVICGVAIPVKDLTTLGIEALTAWLNEFRAGL